tara:strand:+ start:291 stop:482 length:192 start_codon:yes stop_codon:yes gene_type:complete
MDTKQIAIYLIIAGALLILLKFISFLMSDTLIGLSTVLIVAGSVMLSMRYIKDSKDNEGKDSE